MGRTYEQMGLNTHSKPCIGNTFHDQNLVIRRQGTKLWQCRHEEFGKTEVAKPETIYQFVIGIGTSPRKAIQNWRNLAGDMYVALLHARMEHKSLDRTIKFASPTPSEYAS
jgi:hypothetical protein